MRLRQLPGLLKAAFADWREDKASRLAAALAYYTVFSIVPLLVTAVAIAGLFFAVLFGASGVFGQLQDGLDTIWEMAPKPGRGILGLLEDRFVSFTMVLGVGFLLLVSLLLSAALGALDHLAERVLGSPAVVLQILHAVVSLGVVTLLFAMIYRIVPDVEIAWRDVWIGAFVTALLFTVGKLLIGLYLGSGSVGSDWGAAGALVILLVWVYYSAQICFFGAEFTQVYANRFGSRIVPDEDAVVVTEEARARQGMPSAERKESVASDARKARSRSLKERKDNPPGG